MEQLESRLLLAADAPAVMLADINAIVPGSNPGQIVPVGDKIFFVGSDGYHGQELFVTDGSNPPEMVLDIMPGFAGSEPRNLVSFQGLLYFSADDGVNGRELWVSNGSPGGTGLTANLRAETVGENGEHVPVSSEPTLMTPAGDMMFLVADGEGVGRELWLGSGSSFEVVADINPNVDASGNPEWSDPRSLLFVPEHTDADGNLVPDSVFFSADDGQIGRELWRADLSGNVFLVKDTFPGFRDVPGMPPNSSNPTELFLFQGKVYYQAAGVKFDEDGNAVRDAEGNLIPLGTELWRSDGSATGTELVRDISNGTFTDAQGTVQPHSSFPSGFTIHNGFLYYAATDNTLETCGCGDPGGGRELWRTGGTPQRTELVHNIRPGFDSSNPTELTSVGDTLFFRADGGQGPELWKYDGTDTTLVKDIEPGVIGSGPDYLARLGDSVVFAAFNNVPGPELWISDGTEDGTRLLKDIARGSGPRGGQNARFLVNVNDIVYFQANDRTHGSALWRTDGTTDGTVIMDADTIGTLGSNPNSLASAGGLLYFAADDAEHGIELWKSDGTTRGTRMVKDIFTGLGTAFPNSSEPSGFTALGELVFFRATTDQSGTELWVTDGTELGTRLLKNINPNGDSFPHEFIRLDNRMIFAATTADEGEEPWISDGTPEGTTLLADIAMGLDSTFPHEFTVANSRVFFVATTDKGQELWSTNGTPVGTSVVADMSGGGDSAVHNLVGFGSTVLFVANDGVLGPELWSSDGTSDGTMLLKDIRVTQDVDFDGSNPMPLAVVGQTLFFFADDGLNGVELWRTDGTPDNTVMVKDIYPGEFGSYCEADTDGPFPLAAAMNGKLFFAAADDVHGCELWVTDGTPENTMLVLDLFPGDLNSAEPANFMAGGNRLFFTAETNGIGSDGLPSRLGRELWSSDGTAAGTTVHSDINTVTMAGSDPLELTNVGGIVYFTATDAIHGREVWTTTLRLKADDFLFEMLARDFAYRELPDGSTISLADFGYDWPAVFTVEAIRDPVTSFDAFGLTSPNMDPILAVRGSFEIPDAFSDANPRGIGVDQFEANRDRVRGWLTNNTRPGHPVSITGHSLGGALTQLITADFTAQANGRLDQVVTFNAPGISHEFALPFRPDRVDRVKHYVTNGDPVSLAGNEFLPGQWRLSTFKDLDLSHNHTLPILIPSLTDDPATPANETTPRPPDVTFVEYPTVEWLNDPFYFHTDNDYVLELAAAYILVSTTPELQQFSHVPPAALFRFSTEAIRQQIGQFLQDHQAAVDNVVATLTCTSPGARVQAPDFEVNLLSLLRIQASELSAACLGGTPPTLKLQGLVRLPQLNNATADFTGDNYLSHSELGFKMVGTVSIDSLPLLPGIWDVQNLVVGINTVSNRIDARGELRFPFGINVASMLEFVNGQFNFISLDAHDLNKPILSTGLFLQRIAGRVDNVAAGDPDPILFGGAVGATGGPEIQISLPSWAGGDFSGSLIRLDVDGQIDQNHLAGAGVLSLIRTLASARGLVEVNGTAELNWGQGFLSAQGRVDLLAGLITSDAAIRTDSSLNLNMAGTATFGVPDVIPFIGGTDAVSGNFALDFTNDSSLGNDFAAAWTTFNVPFVGPTVLGFRVYLNGSFDLLGGEDVAAIQGGGAVAAMVAARPHPTAGSTALAAHVVGHTVASSQFPIAPATDWVLFAAEWNNESPDTTIVLTTPAGQMLTEADIAARADMAIVPDLSDTTRRVVVVQNPAAGNWTVSVNDDQGPVNLNFSALAESDAPIVDIVRLTGGSRRSPVEIALDAFDPDSDARVSLYYDTDSTSLDGVLIASGLIESDGRQTFGWQTAGVPEGDYLIYAMIDDGEHAPMFAYSPTSVTIADGTVGNAPMVSIMAPMPGTDVIEGTTVEVQVDAIDDGDVERVELLANGQMLEDSAEPFQFLLNVPVGITSLTLNARATDSAGNRTDAAPVVIDVVPDRPPTVNIVTPVDGSGVIAGSTIPVRADADDDVGVQRVEFLVNGVLQATASSSPFQADVVIPPGSSPVRIEARATDTAGHSTPSVVTVNPTIAGDQPPTVRIVELTASQTVIEGSTITVRADAMDDVGLAAVDFIVSGVTTTDATAPFEFQLQVPAGVTTLTLNATARDTAGHETDAVPVVLRVVPPSDVTAVVRRGRLSLQGDAAANDLLVEFVAQNTYRVTGRNGTPVNGRFEPVEFAGVRRGVVAALLDGDDSFEFTSNDLAADSLSVNTGSGSDIVSLHNARMRGTANISTSLGDDTVEIIDTVLAKLLASLGDGNDRLTIRDSRLGQRGTANTQEFQPSNFQIHTLLDGGLGHDTLDAGILGRPNANGNTLLGRGRRVRFESPIS